MQRVRLVGLTLLICISMYAICFLTGNPIAAETERLFVPSDIKLENGLLSVSLQDAQLKDVLEEISIQSGIKIVLEKTLERKLTMTFKNLPLEKGLKKLLEGTDYYMVFSPGETDRPYSIKEVKIIPHSSGSSARRSKKTKPAPTTRSPNPFIEALRSGKKKGDGSKNLTPEQKNAIIEVFGKGSEENRRRAEELLRKLEGGVKEEKKR